MADSFLSNKDSAVITRRLKRLTTLTIISFALNALVIFLVIVGGILHHPPAPDRFAGRGGPNEGRFDGPRDRDFGPPRHRFGGMGMRGGWDRPGDFRGGPDDGDRFGDRNRGPDRAAMPPPPDPARMSDDILSHLSQRLTLTDDEKAKIKPIIDEQVGEIQKQREAQRAAVQKQIQDAKAKIKTLLTPDQQKELDALPLPGQPPGP